MENSWCKVVDNQVVDGPRAWHENTPPDNTWLPHSLEEPAHTINDKYVGSRLEVRGSEVVEVKMYEPKSSEQIADEINNLKKLAQEEVAYADEKLLQAGLANRTEWETHKTLWSRLLNITELSWDYRTPSRPIERE